MGNLFFTMQKVFAKEWMEIPIPERKYAFLISGDSKISEVYGLERSVDLLNEEEWEISISI